MQIKIGSQNQVKINAVKETISLYPNLFPNAKIDGISIDIEEFGHPIGFELIFNCARDRAVKAFKNCDYSIGLESGLVEIQCAKSGYMEISSCVIYDGTDFYHGLGCGFEYPVEVTNKILNKEGDASSLFKELNLTDSKKLGAEKGGILGVLAKGRMTREEQIKQSVISALIYMENPKLR